MSDITIFSPMFTDFSEEGRDEENHWYDTDHVPQRLSVEGFMSASRYERLDTLPAGSPAAPLRYINAYRITGPEVVTSAAYESSYRHLTPRSRSRTFPVTVPTFRDVWSLVHSAGALASADGARTLLLSADEPGGEPGNAKVFLGETAVPTLLSCPGFLRAYVFERTDVPVALATDSHAPRFLTAVVLSSAEAATRADYADRIAAIAEENAASGSPLTHAWTGLYTRRPSPWTTAPL